MRPACARRGGALELLRGTGRSPDRPAYLQRRCAGAGLLPHLALDLRGEARVLPQVVADVLATLSQALVAVGHPRPALLEDRVLDRRVDERALARDAFVEKDVELGRAERRSHLVLDDLDLDARAHRVQAVLDHLDLADVEPHRGVELERPAARLRLRVAEHDAALSELLRDLAEG